MKTVVVTGSFDDLRSHHVRFLEEAARFGNLHVLLWSDETARALGGIKFSQDERLYMLRAVRYVSQITLVTGQVDSNALPQMDAPAPHMWVVNEQDDNAQKRAFCASRGLEYQVLRQDDLKGFPVWKYHAPDEPSSRKKAIVTGCFDWLHSGHVRFFEETSELGDLYVIIGHDENVRLLKGAGHPMFSQDERRYVVQSIRYVTQALISTGHGWMDAAPEIDLIKPDRYVVNEDGDKPEKRAFCAEHGIEYVVLKRTPKDGLESRSSTALRGF